MGGKTLPPLFLLPPSIVQEVLKFSTVAVERIIPTEEIRIAYAKLYLFMEIRDKDGLET